MGSSLPELRNTIDREVALRHCSKVYLGFVDDKR